MPKNYFKKYPKKKYPKRKYRINRNLKPFRPTEYYYKQTYVGAGLESGTVLDTATGMMFKLSSLPQAATFTALYDEYCILKVVVKFQPQGSLNNNTDPVSFSVPPFYTAIDYDDATPVASLNEILEYQTVKSTSSAKVHTRVFVPKLAAFAYKTSGTTIGYSDKSHQYVDCASSDIEHYGLKTWLPRTGGAYPAIIKYVPIITMYVKFRGVR